MKKTIENQKAEIKNLEKLLAEKDKDQENQFPQKDKDCLEKLAKIKDLENQLAQKDKVCREKLAQRDKVWREQLAQSDMNWREKLVKKGKDCLEKLAKIKDLEEQLAQLGKDQQELFAPENIQCLISSLNEWISKGMRGDLRDFFNNEMKAYTNVRNLDEAI